MKWKMQREIFLTFSNFTAVFSIKHKSLKEVIFGAARLMLEFIVRYCFFKTGSVLNNTFCALQFNDSA